MIEGLNPKLAMIGLWGPALLRSIGAGWAAATGRQFEAENARLKKLVAERDLEIEVMKEVAAKNW